MAGRSYEIGRRVIALKSKASYRFAAGSWTRRLRTIEVNRTRRLAKTSIETQEVTEAQIVLALG